MIAQHLLDGAVGEARLGAETVDLRGVVAEVADGPRSIVLRQVAAGVAVREAALEALAGNA